METILKHPYIALISFLMAFALHINIEAQADVKELLMEDTNMITSLGASSVHTTRTPHIKSDIYISQYKEENRDDLQNKEREKPRSSESEVKTKDSLNIQLNQ